MQFLLIVGQTILFAIIYGILHDQITVRICPEYFTIGHPPVFQTASLTMLAVGWGIIATWWVGAILGVPLACIARIGKRPKLTAISLIKPVVTLLAVMAGVAVAAGIVGYVLAHLGYVFLIGTLATKIPGEKHAAFLADAWAHSASYGVGFLGGIVLIVRTWRFRKRLDAVS